MPQLDKFIFLNLVFWTIVLYVFVEIIVYFELPRISFMIKTRNRLSSFIYDRIFYHTMLSFFEYASIKIMAYHSLNLIATYINFNKKIIKRIKEK